MSKVAQFHLFIFLSPCTNAICMLFVVSHNFLLFLEGYLLLGCLFPVIETRNLRFNLVINYSKNPENNRDKKKEKYIFYNNTKV